MLLILLFVVRATNNFIVVFVYSVAVSVATLGIFVYETVASVRSNIDPGKNPSVRNGLKGVVAYGLALRPFKYPREAATCSIEAIVDQPNTFDRSPCSRCRSGCCRRERFFSTFIAELSTICQHRANIDIVA
jgi:hypothetical protein